MKPYSDYSPAEIAAERDALAARYETAKQRGLKLNMTRGVPSLAQLELSRGLLTCLGDDDYLSESGIDCRNYGVLDGIPEMKRIFADILDLEPEEVVVGGNSSLALMFDNIASNMSHGVRDGTPWRAQGQIKFLCPSPGYDRHFSICQYFLIDMIPVPMTADGPDMDVVEQLVSSDPMIKGMWCIPVFSNPTGAVYSDETVRRIAGLRPAAPDFRVYWDNAYAIHQLSGGKRSIPNLVRECAKAGNENMPLVFTSFSKVTFSGAAVTCTASSRSNCDYIKKRLSAQTIGSDKLRQLAHVRYFGGTDGVYAHMQKHAAILKPKFDLVGEALRRNLDGLGIANWTAPEGGYFVSFNAMRGCAKRIVRLCAEAGVSLTPAGATYPYGIDPDDSNIRIAPTFPPPDELRDAMEIFCLAAKLACAEKLAD